MTLSDLPTRSPATLLRIERLLRQCEPPPRSDRAAGLGRAGEATQIPRGVSVCEWMGAGVDRDAPE